MVSDSPLKHWLAKSKLFVMQYQANSRPSRCANCSSVKTWVAKQTLHWQYRPWIEADAMSSDGCMSYSSGSDREMTTPCPNYNEGYLLLRNNRLNDLSSEKDYDNGDHRGKPEYRED